MLLVLVLFPLALHRDLIFLSTRTFTPESKNKFPGLSQILHTCGGRVDDSATPSPPSPTSPTEMLWLTTAWSHIPFIASLSSIRESSQKGPTLPRVGVLVGVLVNQNNSS